MYTTAQQQQLQDLRKLLNEQMNHMELSITDQDQYNDAVNAFNTTLYEYREIIMTAYNKVNYDI